MKSDYIWVTYLNSKKNPSRESGYGRLGKSRSKLTYLRGISWQLDDLEWFYLWMCAKSVERTNCSLAEVAYYQS